MGRGSALTCDGNTAEWSHQNPMIRLSRCLTANFLFGVNHFLSAQLLSSAGWCSISHANPSDKAWRASRHGGSRVWLQPCFVHCFLQIEVTGLSGAFQSFFSDLNWSYRLLCWLLARIGDLFAPLDQWCSLVVMAVPGAGHVAPFLSRFRSLSPAPHAFQL